MDSSVFEAAYAVHGASVLRYATYSVGSRQVAEDIAAEAWSRYLEKGDCVPADRVEAWLIRVTRNLCVSHHRAVARGRKLEARVAETVGSRADGWEDPHVWDFVRELSESERLTIYLRIVEERSFPEVARVLGRSEGAAKMTFYRALDRLRHTMGTTATLSEPIGVGGADDV